MPSQDYPDIRVKKSTKDAVAQYLFTEIDTAITARSDVQQLWKNIQTLYEQTEVKEKKDFPFEGAATVMIPVIPTYVEQVHAKIQDTVYAGHDTYSVLPTRDDLTRLSKAIRKWLTWAGENELHEEEIDYNVFMELLKLGTTATKMVYVREEKTLYKWNPTLKKYEKRIEIVKDSPEYIHIGIDNLLYPMNARRIEEAEWRDHRFHLTWNEMKRRAAAGLYNVDAIKEIQTWYVTTKTDYEAHRDELTMAEPTSMYEFELHDVWFNYPIELEPDEMAPIDEMQNIMTFAEPTELTGVFHRESRTFLRLQHNHYPLGLDPFEICTFVGREHQIMGIGIGQMALPFQIEVTTMHNQRLDNGTIVNCVAYKYKSDSRVPQELALKPGCGIPVDEMDDLEPFSMGTKADSTIEAEAATLQFLQERIGTREMSLDDMAMSQAPATTAIAMMQERGRRLDNVLRRIRRFKKRNILKAVLLYQQYYPKEKLLDIFGQEDGTLIIEALSLSPQTIWSSMGIDIAATTSATSRALARMQKIELFNVLLTYYDKYSQAMVNAAAPGLPPGLAEMLIKVGSGLTEFVGELFEDSSITNKAEFLLPAPAAPGPPQLPPGGGGAPSAGPEAPPSMVPPAANGGQPVPPPPRFSAAGVS